MNASTSPASSTTLARAVAAAIAQNTQLTGGT
jgi:hypothetical protein